MSNLPAKTSALTALAAIAPADQNLNQVENQVSTGLAISTAAGNPAYWPIAAKMTANSGAPGAVDGALGESQPLVSTMSSALNTTISAMDAMNITAAAGDLANMPADVETAIGSILTAASTLGATTTNLRTQWTYVSNPSDSLTTGVGSLVDANMNEAAAKLATLQVQQQLGVPALSISHSNTQPILKVLELYNLSIGK